MKMTVITKYPYDKEYIEQYSQDKNEPEWMKAFRLQALEQANVLELPKPDKTRIHRWNFSQFKHLAEGEVISSLNELPEELKDHLDIEDRKSTRLNSSHVAISYAVFCLKKKITTTSHTP